MTGPRPDWQLRPHGTPAAYRRHYRRGERPCEACRRAEALRHADRGDRTGEYAAKRERYAAAREAGLGAAEASFASRVPGRLEQILAGAS